MEPLIPFMLFILMSGEDGPELVRHPELYRDEQTCQAAANEIVPTYSANAEAPVFWCLELPGEQEFGAMIQRLEADHVARREAREAERARPDASPTQ